MRFTKKDRYGHFYTNEANCRNIHSLDGKKLEGEFYENQTLAIDGNAIEKLGQLEDSEEELGIDLATLIKALKDEIWVKKSNNYIDNYAGWLLSFQEDCFVVGYGGDTYAYYFKDYGKTWALTREELEGDR